MYEVGKQRYDGSYNVWRTENSDWIIVRVYDELEEAQEYATIRNTNRGRRQKSLYKGISNDT